MKNNEKATPIGLNASISIGNGLSINCYMVMGAFRYGLSQASELLGYEKTYLSQVVLREQNKLKELQDKGFTGCLLEIKVSRARPKTLSFDDFCILVEHEAIEVKNPKAIALLTASFRELLRSRTLDAFGLPEESLEAKQAAFWEAYQEREAAWTEDREDLNNLMLLGDNDINLAEYDSAAAKWENDYLVSKYFDDVA